MWRLQAATAGPSVASGVLDVPCDTCKEHIYQSLLGEDNDEESLALIDDDEEKQRLIELREAFWREREAAEFWQVPMGRDLDEMPWLPKRSAGVIEAIQRARRMHRRTALLIDNSPDKVVDTYFMYRSTQILEAKQMVMEERMRKKNRAQILESARQRLVNAMRYGQTFYVRMSNTATSFKTHYTSPTTLPLAIFDQSCMETLRSEYMPPALENLFGSSHPLAGALRESDTEHGFFQCRHGFEVVVSTHLAKADVADMLGRALPMEMLQPIVPVVKPRLPNGASSSALALKGGEEGAEEAVDEDKPWTRVEEAHEAAVRLREKVEAARERRTGRVGPNITSSSRRRAASSGASTTANGPTSSGGPPVASPGGFGGLSNCIGNYQREHARRLPTSGLLMDPSREEGVTIIPADTDDAPPPVTMRCYASAEELERERQMRPARSLNNTDLLQHLQRTMMGE